MAITVQKDSRGRLMPGVEKMLAANGFQMTEDSNALTVFRLGRVGHPDDESAAQILIDGMQASIAKAEALTEKRRLIIEALENRLQTLVNATESDLNDYGFRVMAVMFRALYVANPTLTKPTIIRKLIEVYEKGETEIAALNAAQDWKTITEKDPNSIVWPW